jgi:UDP-N-acetylmuramoyl-tripeptide--D-alanyl-D-alanine ligase
MLELGSAEESFHREIAKQLIEESIENVLLYGPRMIFLSDELKLRGFRGYHAHFNTHAELAQELISRFQPGDTLLIKGSRGMKMEEVWKILQDYTSTHWNELKVKS